VAISRDDKEKVPWGGGTPPTTSQYKETAPLDRRRQDVDHSWPVGKLVPSGIMRLRPDDPTLRSGEVFVWVKQDTVSNAGQHFVELLGYLWMEVPEPVQHVFIVSDGGADVPPTPKNRFLAALLHVALGLANTCLCTYEPGGSKKVRSSWAHRV
jgi:hypothetical protein